MSSPKPAVPAAKARRPRRITDADEARRLLAAAGLPRAHDVLLVPPLDFIDETKLVRLADAPRDAFFLAEVRIEQRSERPLGRNVLLECIASDASGTITLHCVNPAPWARGMLEKDSKVRILGKLGYAFDPLSQSEQPQPMHQPHLYRPGGALKSHLTARYGTISKANIASLGKLVKAQLKELAGQDDPIPPGVRARTATLPIATSMRIWHQPRPEELARERPRALQSLKFDEWLAHILLQRRDRIHFKRARVPPIASKAADARLFAAKLPFALTAAQEEALAAVAADLKAPSAMRRLIHGDVGCGKTVVAAFACWLTARAGQTAALMCPTTILAHQHHRRLKELFAALGTSCHLLTSELKASERKKSLARIKLQQNCVIVGTHALLQESVDLPALRLAVIDEQHRFGVAQSKALASKGKGANVLLMSATPIPRTLELGMLAQMDMTRMGDRPARGKITTLVASAAKANEVLAKISDRDMQTYWIFPMIRKGAGALRAAEDEYARIRLLMPDLPSALIHGKMGNAEKLAAMRGFEDGASRLLVATTVVEVGVDAPEADMIVIDHAERLGLSQLHQLRGRVGRGGKPGYCVLLYEPGLSATAKRRLQTMRESTDGFEIAAMDLKLRGPGDIIGKRQSGARKYHFADYLADQQVLELAHAAADELLESDEAAAKRHAQFWLGGKVPRARDAS